jgi:hypothetical protein
MATCELLLAWPGIVCLVSGYTPMSPVPALFWHAAGTRRRLGLLIQDSSNLRCASLGTKR